MILSAPSRFDASTADRPTAPSPTTATVSRRVTGAAAPDLVGVLVLALVVGLAVVGVGVVFGFGVERPWPFGTS